MSYRKSYLLAAGIIGPAIALISVFSDVFLSPWFSWSLNALSDLGVHKYSFLFDGGLIIEAILNVVFVAGLSSRFRNMGISAPLLIISGASLGFVGVFNENHHPFHTIFAMIYFLLFPIAIIIFSYKTRSFFKKLSWFGILTAVFSLIAIFFGIGMVFNFLSLPDVGLAIPEIVEAVLLSAWMITAGSLLLISGEKMSPDSVAAES